MNEWIPFSCFTLRVLLLWMLASYFTPRVLERAISKINKIDYVELAKQIHHQVAHPTKDFCACLINSVEDTQFFTERCLLNLHFHCIHLIVLIQWSIRDLCWQSLTVLSESCSNCWRNKLSSDSWFLCAASSLSSHHYELWIEVKSLMSLCSTDPHLLLAVFHSFIRFVLIIFTFTTDWFEHLFALQYIILMAPKT